VNRSRLILLTVALLAGLGSAVLTVQAVREQSAEAPPPTLPPEGLIAVENPLDFGDIPQDVVSGNFKLVNRTGKPVRIIQIVESCNCSEIVIPDRDIVPDETVSMPFKWNSSGVRGEKGSKFTVFYAEEERIGLRSLVLYVKGNVLPKFDLVPATLEFTDGEPETKTVTLVPRDKSSDITIEDVSDAMAAFRVEKLDDRTIAVTFKPDDWFPYPGDFPYIVVKTNYEGERQCDVPIRVREP
jgi:hypothetical protein